MPQSFPRWRILCGWRSSGISRNLTPGPGGLKDWTDAEIAHTIRTGLNRLGQALKPPMAFWFYKNIADADMAALIAYLRSLEPARDTLSSTAW